MNAHRFCSLSGLAALSLALSACVVEPAYYGPPGPPPRVPPPAAVYVPRPIALLPYGARPYYYRGEHCWYHHGHYYRRNPHGHGYIVFAP